jgi:alkylated DNA repair dioxygenase AlkB
VSALTWQISLLDDDPGEGPRADPGFVASRRRLDDGAWIDHVPGWLEGSDALLATCVESLPWGQRDERIQGRRVPQPRLTASLRLLGELPPELAILDELGQALSQRYRVRFRTVGANLYRDGRDSVAWHGDRVLRERLTATVATVSLGHPRTFRLRPAAGGSSVGMVLGRGDLLVMGGTCQRTWKHSVPKVASAGVRVSLAFRHADPAEPVTT